MRYEIRTPTTNNIHSPVNPAIQYPEFNILFANSLGFGVQTGDKSLVNMHEVHTIGKVQIKLNLRRKELEVQFPLTIDDRSHNFCFRLPISQLSHVHKTQNKNASSSLIIPFDHPPQFFVQKKPTREDDSLFPTQERTWNVWSTMFRETDVVDGHTRIETQTEPLKDHKDSVIIDIGRTLSR